MKTIMAATDLSDRSATALARAASIAAATGARLRIVHVVDDSLPGPMLARHTGEAEEALRQEAAGLAGLQAECEVVSGDVFWALHSAATRSHADLIVAGDHRRSLVRDLFRDTTIERLIRVSAVPVLIARTAVLATYRHALVGVEGEEADELLAVLPGLGMAAPARATLLHAISAPAEGLLYYAGVEREVAETYRDAIAQKARARLARALRDSPLPADIRIATAAPATALADYARSAGCDLVAVSSHARRFAASRILGSVSSELVRQGTTDLVIVPRLVAEPRG